MFGLVFRRKLVLLERSVLTVVAVVQGLLLRTIETLARSPQVLLATLQWE